VVQQAYVEALKGTDPRRMAQTKEALMTEGDKVANAANAKSAEQDVDKQKCCADHPTARRCLDN
jgi:hypothetical protein